MEWLSQNWIGLALAVAALVLLVRGFRSGGCCGNGSRRTNSQDDRE